MAWTTQLRGVVGAEVCGLKGLTGSEKSKVVPLHADPHGILPRALPHGFLPSDSILIALIPMASYLMILMALVLHDLTGSVPSS
eukprot:4354742-Amphidinium_carterae.1